MDRTVLEEQIRTAFAGVRLGSGVSLRQAQIADGYGDGVSDEEYAAAPKSEQTDDWTKLSSHEPGFDYVAHLDAEGLRYYLPALMLSVLDDYEAGSMRVIGTINSLDPRGAFATWRFDLLSETQRRAVASFLEYLLTLPDLWDEHRKVASRSLRAYWGAYAEDSRAGT